jgi:hypothetical protein
MGGDDWVQQGELPGPCLHHHGDCTTAYDGIIALNATAGIITFDQNQFAGQYKLWAVPFTLA